MLTSWGTTRRPLLSTRAVTVLRADPLARAPRTCCSPLCKQEAPCLETRSTK